MHIHSPGCALDDFLRGPMFDQNLDINNLAAIYPTKTKLKLSCKVGYSGSSILICVHGQWQSTGTRCQRKFKSFAV